MSDDGVYLKLREYLDDLPGSFPATESGVEIRILKKLFTPEQAAIELQMLPLPETPSAFAERVNMDETEAAERLETMSKQGLIFRYHDGDDVLYVPVSFVVGIYEFQLNRLDQEFSELLEEYFPYVAKGWEANKTLQLRVVPIQSSVTPDLNVAPYDHVRELIKDKTLIAVSVCICTKDQELRGKPCSRPPERCISFGMAARFYIDNGMARQIDQDELMALLKMGEEQALVLSPSNCKDLRNFCLCCDCCCGWLRALRWMENPAEHVQSTYVARIDADFCTACGLCAERCQMDAIKELDDVSEVDMLRCIGCGLCISTCPEQAITLKEKSDVGTIPDNLFEMLMRIAQERGKIS